VSRVGGDGRGRQGMAVSRKGLQGIMGEGGGQLNIMATDVVMVRILPSGVKPLKWRWRS